ncbi:MAG TPA: tetratricopeptide repeat protein [Candidatus Angelobacter sp.]|nr:tetratricopeptide repeat protein [Candidatus Angelobacter sp.]
MKFQNLEARMVVLFFCLAASITGAPAQMKRDSAETNKREQALRLFDQDKRLEALPLLEELAQKNPNDEAIEVCLAGSLVTHAATLTDQHAAAAERLRAESILEKSGSNNTLAKNLLQLLREMPDGADTQFSANPAVEQAMRAGEAAFSRRDYDEAIQNYSKALELEPKNYAAVLFIGNTFFKKQEFAKADEWYEKAIQLDPNIETGYRYYADTLARQGDMAKSRSMLIHAVVAEPYNRMVWRDLMTWAALNATRINFNYAGLVSDPEPNAKKNEPLFEVKLFPQRPRDLSDAWREYQAVRGDWKERGKFKQHFPQESGYRHSLAEETEALTAEVRALEALRGDIGTAELVLEDQPLLLLVKLHEAGVLEPYILFRLADEGIAKDYAAYRDKHRDKLEEYMDEFVVPPAPARNN